MGDIIHEDIRHEISLTCDLETWSAGAAALCYDCVNYLGYIIDFQFYSGKVVIAQVGLGRDHVLVL